jgi:hypothetical protein
MSTPWLLSRTGTYGPFRFDCLHQLAYPFAWPNCLAKLCHIQLIGSIVNDKAATNTKSDEGRKHHGPTFVAE